MKRSKQQWSEEEETGKRTAMRASCLPIESAAYQRHNISTRREPVNQVASETNTRSRSATTTKAGKRAHSHSEEALLLPVAIETDIRSRMDQPHPQSPPGLETQEVTQRTQHSTKSNKNAPHSDKMMTNCAAKSADLKNCFQPGLRSVVKWSGCMNAALGGSVVTRMSCATAQLSGAVKEGNSAPAGSLSSIHRFYFFTKNVALNLKALQDIRSYMFSHHVNNQAASQFVTTYTYKSI